MEQLLHNTSQPIEKESISDLSFPKEEVLSNRNKIALRAIKLARAVRLGNLEKHKVQIDFKDSASVRHVQTTIWSITEYFAILKSNVRIPVNRILDVRIL